MPDETYYEDNLADSRSRQIEHLKRENNLLIKQRDTLDGQVEDMAYRISNLERENTRLHKLVDAQQALLDAIPPGDLGVNDDASEWGDTHDGNPHRDDVQFPLNPRRIANGFPSRPRADEVLPAEESPEDGA